MHVIVFVLVLLLGVSFATQQNGVLDKPDYKWHYLGKFCYSNYDPTLEKIGAMGSFTYNIRTKSNTTYIVLYLGTSNYTWGNGAWDIAYEASRSGTWSCQQLVDAHRDPGKRLIVSGQQDAFFPWQTSRAYFWYFAVADCSNSSEGLDLSYSITYLNPGNYWWAQFSYDEQGVPQMYIFFTIFYMILVALQSQAAYSLQKIESFHPIVRILTATVYVHFVSCLAEKIHYLVYGSNGIGVPFLRGFGDLTAMAGQIMMMFMCILVAKGWAITTNYLTDRIVIIGVTVLYFIAHLSLFIWDNVGRDPASTLYFYDSVPGLIVIILRLGLTGWFLWCLRTTIQLESLAEKKNFYIYFGGIYTLWFLLLPAIVAFALVLEPWFRMRTVTGMMLSADALSMLFFCVLLAPSRASKYFNIKTTPQLLEEQRQRLTGYGATSTSATQGYEAL